MTVKDRVGRTRYLAFELDGAPARRELARRIAEAAARAWTPEDVQRAGLYLAAFDGRRGLLKARHWSLAPARALLEGLGARTLGASGTARAAKEKWLRR